PQRGPGGPNFEGPQREDSVTGLDPLVAITDRDKPLRSKVLAVPKYREQYLSNLRTLADRSLRWENIGPLIESHAALIEDSVKA
ncbi:MAG: spore coat protein CotH, partial [Planctomycetota bacterium]